MSRFDIGKEVYVKHNGTCYSTYDSFFEENELSHLESNFVYGENIPKGMTYKIIDLGRHSSGCEIIVLQNEDDQVYLMEKSKRDIKKVKKGF